MIPVIMPEKKNCGGVMAPSNKCSCCPYGFHIDRDFVRYCDSLYNTAQLDKLRQHKRERRKEKKTVESYLGLGNSITLEPERKCPEVPPRNASTLPRELNLKSNVKETRSVLTLPHDLDLNGDGLKNAMLDFEDTWQKSLRKSSSSSDIEKRNGFKPLNVSPITTKAEDQKESYADFNINRSRRSSTSSDSSQSTAISSASVPITSDHAIRFMASQQTTYSTYTLPKPRENSPQANPGVDKNVLNNIREQMASSLKRMRELEDQVKTIPLLQVKIYSLTEERKSLLNKLHLNDANSSIENSTEGQKCLEKQLQRLENEGIMSPTLTRKCLSQKQNEEDLFSPGIASCLNASFTKQELIKKEVFPHSQLNDSKNLKVVKNAATSCSVLTRDIGIGYVPNKYKSIAVGSDISFKDLVNSYKNKKGFDNFTSVSSESLESDSESPGVSDEPSRSFTHCRFTTNVPSNKYTSNIPAKICVAASTNTDIKHLCNKSINTITPVSAPSEKVYKHKSISVSPLVSAKYVQTLDKKTFRNVSIQTILEPQPKEVIKCDSSVGDFNINDTICATCNKVKKSIAVGDFSIKSVVCDQCASLQPNAHPNTAVHKTNCENCVLRQTETVGVGDYDVSRVECENCEREKSEVMVKTKSHSIGVNTTADFSNVTKADMHICDKCSATIQSVAQGFAANTADSKIPRPNLKSSTKTSFTKLPKLNRPQDLKGIKMDEASAVKDGHAYLKETVHQKVIVTKRIDSETIQNTPTNSQKSVRDGNDGKLFSQSSNSEVLPDFTDLPVLPHKKRELSKEVKAACKVLNDYLQRPERGGEKKTLSSLTIIQNEWFRVANQKKADPHLIEDYLDAYEDFSKLLLHKVVNLSDNNGNTALHYAISYGNFDVVSILIDSKVCDVNKKNKAGYTSIMLVALADMKNDTHHYVVQRLFSIGDINIKATQNGQTALMLAVSHGKKDIVKMLLDAGSEINLQDKDGSTALMCAAEHGHIEIVKLLLSHPDCDPAMVDSDGCNALAIAMEAGYKDIGLLIYTNMNFSRGSSPYSTLKTRKRSTPRSTPPPRTPTLRTPPLPSPSARSTNSIPSSFHFPS